MYFSVLIIDDEFYICDSLKTKLKNLDFPEIQEIRTCYSGEEALELCETFRPSIVITDIEMEGINGIDLIHELKKKLHPVRFLVLSGYDNYEYIRKSFLEGVTDYLLKPILLEDLKRIISDQLKWLKHEVPATAAVHSRSSSITLAEQFIQNLMHPLDNNILDTLIGNLTFPFCRILCISWEPKKDYFTLELLARIYNHYAPFANFLTLACSMSSEKVFVLLNTGSKTDFSLSFWENLIETCQKDHFLKIAIGISNWSSPTALPALYYEAENQLARRLFEGYKKIYQGDFIQSTEELPSKLRQLTLQIFSNPELASNHTFSKKWTAEMRTLSLPQLKRYYNFFSGTYISFTSYYASGWIPTDLRNFYDFSNYEQLEKYLFERISTCIAYTCHNSKARIELVKNYVDDHFTEPLKMSEVADHFFISYSHLSKQFHEKVGMTFQEYLFSKRMTYAAELLHDPFLSIQEISSKVGYDNVFNFSRAFKKHYGIAPTHYREL